MAKKKKPKIKTEAVQDYLKIWGEYEQAGGLIEAHQKNPHNPRVIETILKKVYEGTEIDPHNDPKLGGGGKDPDTIIAYLETFYNISRTNAFDYADGNLEKILNGTKEKHVKDSLDALMPYDDTGNEKHDAIAKLHKDYMKLRQVVNFYLKGNEEKSVASDIMHSKARSDDDNDDNDNNNGEKKRDIDKYVDEHLAEVDKKRGLSEEQGKRKGAQVWAGALRYDAYKDPVFAVTIYKQLADKKQDEMLKRLGGKEGMITYIKRNLEKAKDEEKEGFYRELYRLNSKER